jgi:PhnB protein
LDVPEKEDSMQPDDAAPCTITPHIVARDAVAASDWYQRALGAVERTRLPLPNGKVMYVELRFGNSTVMVADEFPEFGVVSPLTIGDTAVVLHMVFDDVDSAWKRAVEAGAEVAHPLQDEFWGDRQGQLLDPFGHKWGLAQHVRDVPQAELERAAAAMFGGVDT